MPRRRYTALQAGKAGILLAVEAAPAALDDATDNPPGQIVHRYDLKTRKSDVPLTGVNNFQMSFGGEKALYRQGEDWIVAGLGPMAEGHGGGGAKPPAGAEHGVLKTSNIEVRVDPVQEWKQMYHEAWRTERYWFYDRNTHGLDLKEAEKKYEPYLRNVAARSDLTYLFQEMLGNMVVSHMGTGGGDLPEVKHVETGQREIPVSTGL
jgi:tricorn protease